MINFFLFLKSNESRVIPSISGKLTTSAGNVSNYQNEYFEKFFSCTKVVHKEHLLKFIDKFDCDEFCSHQNNIMEKNSLQFTLNTDEENYAGLNLREANLTNNELLPAPPPRLDKSSLILCHFDLYNRFVYFFK